ncbi:4Fe-4S dicluster domain-containing protein [Methanobacterium formicicum]|uniref:4Fe-4S dicluster domain-containing protein n=1 Tax=Methanobacterium formicicum TaxID=2162 RepID=UPI001185A9FC
MQGHGSGFLAENAQIKPEHEHAAVCSECGVCEEHCPQGIKISQELKEVKEFFF